MTDDEIVSKLQPYINHDIAILFMAVQKVCGGGYAMPDKVLLMIGSEIDKARKLSGIQLEPTKAAGMMTAITAPFWEAETLENKFSAMKRVKEMLDRGQFE